MTAAPRSTSIEPTREQISYFRQLYAGMAQPQIELSTIDGDPLDKKHYTWKQGWQTFTSPGALARAVNAHAAKGLNVYCSISGYERRSRSAPILPSSAIFIDDAPEHGPLLWSLYVKTSPASGQGIIILDEPLPAEERVRLSRRLTAACGGDPSGVDAQQLIRPPGSINGKAKCKGYRSWLKIDSGRCYSVAEVEAATPEVAGRQYVAGANGQRVPLDEATLATAQKQLANLSAIFTPDDIPWRIAARPNMQGFKVLTGEMRFPKHDRPEVQDASMLRFATMKSSLFAHYDDAAIVAIQLHYWNFEHLGAVSDKSTEQVLDDIGGILAKLRAAYPHITPTPVPVDEDQTPEPVPSVERKSRARHDRPKRITDEEYLAWLQTRMDDAHQVHRTRREIAAELKISVPTLDRMEYRIGKKHGTGAIERFASGDRRRSWVTVYALPMMIAPAAVAAVAEQDQPAEALSEQPAHYGSRAHEKEHTPPAAPAPVPQLADAVREAFDAYHGARASLKRVEQYLAANYPDASWKPEAVRYWYEQERDRRQKQRNFQRLVDELPGMKQGKLNRREKWCARLIEQGPDGPDGKQYWLARKIQPYISAEQEQRAPKLERLKAGKRTRYAKLSAPTQPMLGDSFPAEPPPAACVPQTPSADAQPLGDVVQAADILYSQPVQEAQRHEAPRQQIENIGRVLPPAEDLRERARTMASRFTAANAAKAVRT